jgi:hypothetical protein
MPKEPPEKLADMPSSFISPFNITISEHVLEARATGEKVGVVPPMLMLRWYRHCL